MPSELARRLRSRGDEILATWEAAVRALPRAAAAPGQALFDQVPVFLRWLADRLDVGEAAPDDDRDRFGFHHAGERLTQGFDVVEVVAELSLLRECLLDAWEAEPAGITPAEVRLANLEIDHVIALVAMEYVRLAEGGGAAAASPAP
jgi:hypothetical protein